MVAPNKSAQTPHYRAVVVSPHLDDAVFSCGGKLAHLAREGRVLVVNVFTDFSQAPPQQHVSLSTDRIQEDQAAADVLGFESTELDLPDCVCRDLQYLAPTKLFAGETLASDATIASELEMRLTATLAQTTWDELYLPLGVGWHVDHLLCYRTTQALHADPKTRFYEDMPYALIPHAVDRRLYELGHNATGATRMRSGWLVEGWRAAGVVATCPLFSVIPAPFRRWAAPIVAGVFFARQYRRRGQRKLEACSTWQAHLEDISSVCPTKEQACFAYASQIQAFFADPASWETHTRRHIQSFANQSNAWFERYWTQLQS